MLWVDSTLIRSDKKHQQKTYQKLVVTPASAEKDQRHYAEQKQLFSTDTDTHEPVAAGGSGGTVAVLFLSAFFLAPFVLSAFALVFTTASGASAAIF